MGHHGRSSLYMFCMGRILTACAVMQVSHIVHEVDYYKTRAEHM